MGGGINWLDTFFSAGGRLARTPFVISAGLLFLIALVHREVVGQTLHWFTGWLVYPPLLYCATCLLSQRLHDRGKSGWFAAVILIALASIWLDPFGPFDLLGVAVLVWAGVELGVLLGEQGANRFGPNPLGAAQA